MTLGWIVLPDVPGTSGIGAGQVVAHASGRPWLVGDWSVDELTVATVGSVRVAVIGSCPVSATRLAELATRVRTVADLDAVADALPGDHHLVASARGEVRVQGSVTGLHGVAHTTVDGVPVAGDRADVLARLAGAEVDRHALAVRVTCGLLLPPPVCETGMWRGVRTLPPDSYLLMAPQRPAREVRWWRAPDPELSLAEGAGRVREALDTAVRHRRPATGRLATDLSGGMDSTSLAFLAARTTPDLLTVRWGEVEQGNDDAYFAAEAATALPAGDHVVLAQSGIPDVFADPAGITETESPYPCSRTHARIRHTAEALAARGATLHLAGHGGDELFSRTPTYLHSLVRRKPFTALRRLRAHRAMGRWPLGATLAALADPRGLPHWWRAQAAGLTGPPPPRRAPFLGWNFPLRVPAWATPAAVDAARQVLRAAARDARPMAEDRGQHEALASLRLLGPVYRQLTRVYATAGVRLELPYLDRRVVEAALSVRLEERATPWRYKPLLAEAVRGTVPDVIRDRRTKGEFSGDMSVGFRRSLPAIVDLFADSQLVADGLVDADVLRAQLLSPHADTTAVIALESLLGCENWARATASERSGRAPAATT